MENVELSEIKSLLVKLAKCVQCGTPWWFNFASCKICSCCANTIPKTMGQNEAQEFTRKELRLIMHALMLASRECPSQPTQGVSMSAKDDSISAGVQSVQQGEQAVLQSALGKCYDDGEQAGTGPGFTQADIDTAVAAAVGPLNQQVSDLTAKDASDLQAAADAKTASDAAIADLQKQFGDLQSKEGVESGIINGLQGSLSQLQGVVTALSNIINPPAPPAPAPVQPDPSQSSAS